MQPLAGSCRPILSWCKALRFSSLSCRHQSSSSPTPTPVPLAYTKVTNDAVDPTATPILIFHGLFGSKTNWRSIGAQLAARTRRVVYALDLRNHGDSPHVSGGHEEVGIAAMASDIGLFMERTYLERACLLGHSLGGRACCQFAFDSPKKVDKLILADISPINKLPHFDFLTENLFDYCKKVVQDLPAGLDMSRARRQVGQKLLVFIQSKFIVDFFLLSLYKDTDGVIKWKFNIDALKTLVAKRLIDKVDASSPFTGPSLIVHGEKSPYVKIENYDEIRALLPAVQFASIPNAGHYLHVEQTEEFIGHVVRFLQQ